MDNTGVDTLYSGKGSRVSRRSPYGHGIFVIHTTAASPLEKIYIGLSTENGTAIT
jgi:hypothetical protein